MLTLFLNRYRPLNHTTHALVLWMSWKIRNTLRLTGDRRLFMETVQQADRGCDFDFLVPHEEIGVVPRPRG